MVTTIKTPYFLSSWSSCKHEHMHSAVSHDPCLSNACLCSRESPMLQAVPYCLSPPPPPPIYPTGSVLVLVQLPHMQAVLGPVDTRWSSFPACSLSLEASTSEQRLFLFILSVSSMSKQNGHCCWLVLKMMYLHFVWVNSLMLVTNNVNLGAERDSSWTWIMPWLLCLVCALFSKVKETVK